MAYKVIIAEKPSVAKGIAKIVGASQAHTDKANGYLEGNGYRVTWAFGHLVGLVSPEDMGFGNGILPIMPENWKTGIIKSESMGTTISKQMKTLESLFGGADEIIVATDAGREGELIFRYIYEYLHCRTPFRRLWISSLTDEAIRKGLSDLRPGSDYDSLSDAAHARSEADWLVGYNASRALRLATGYRGNLSLGRVQTPVLCMICERFEANKNFVPTPFWQVTSLVHKDMENFPVLTADKYPDEKKAQEACEKARAAGKMTVTKVEKKEIRTTPPLLYDLTALQRAANTKLGLTADETLKTAQSLYEKKYLSYPRTGSRYISEDVYRTIPSLIGKVKGYGLFTSAASELEGRKLCRKSVNDAKVTDHHALLPTENIPSGLQGDEKKIWEMVAGRMLEAFGEDSLSDRTNVEFDSGGIVFRASGSVVTKAGWKSVFGVSEAEEGKRNAKDDEDDEPSGRLPELKTGETLAATKFEVLRKTDKPLPIYTDSSLLGDMETCGKKIDDEELRESLKDVGLGTPATRAQIIETLLRRGYISREAKKLVPTQLGTEIWKTVRGRKIADVRMSGEWERDLSLVEHGQKGKDSFDGGIRRFVLEVIDDLQKNCRPIDGTSQGNEPVRTCPCCGKQMKNMKYSIFCNPEDGGCGYKVPREVAGKKLPESAINALCTGRTTALIKGFTSKNGTRFDAMLDPDTGQKKISYKFNDKAAAPQMQGKSCPCCSGRMEDGRWRLSCSCGFGISKEYGGVTLTEKQIDRLLSGETIQLKGMKNKAGKKYDAGLKVNKADKKIDYVFENKGGAWKKQ